MEWLTLTKHEWMFAGTYLVVSLFMAAPVFYYWALTKSERKAVDSSLRLVAALQYVLLYVAGILALSVVARFEVIFESLFGIALCAKTFPWLAGLFFNQPFVLIFSLLFLVQLVPLSDCVIGRFRKSLGLEQPFPVCGLSIALVGIEAVILAGENGVFPLAPGL